MKRISHILITRTHLVVHNADGIANPRTIVIHLDDTPPGNTVMMRPPRLVIVIALSTSSNPPSSP